MMWNRPIFSESPTEDQPVRPAVADRVLPGGVRSGFGCRVAENDLQVSPRLRCCRHRVGSGRQGQHGSNAVVPAGLRWTRIWPQRGARLTGNFRDSYTSLTNDVVIPGAKQQHISAVATLPAAASISADENHSVVMVFVDQTITAANDPPTGTASAVKVTLDKIGGRWLISGFEPV